MKKKYNVNFTGVILFVDEEVAASYNKVLYLYVSKIRAIEYRIGRKLSKKELKDLEFEVEQQDVDNYLKVRRHLERCKYPENSPVFLGYLLL